MFIQTIKTMDTSFFLLFFKRKMNDWKGFFEKTERGMGPRRNVLILNTNYRYSWCFCWVLLTKRKLQKGEKDEFKSFVRLEKCIKSKAWSTIQHFKFLIIYRHCWGGPGASLPKFHWPQEGWDKLDHQKQFHVKHRKNNIVQVHSLCRISLGKCVENILHCEIYSY